MMCSISVRGFKVANLSIFSLEVKAHIKNSKLKLLKKRVTESLFTLSVHNLFFQFMKFQSDSIYSFEDMAGKNPDRGTVGQKNGQGDFITPPNIV